MVQSVSVGVVTSNGKLFPVENRIALPEKREISFQQINVELCLSRDIMHFGDEIRQCDGAESSGDGGSNVVIQVFPKKEIIEVFDSGSLQIFQVQSL